MSKPVAFTVYAGDDSVFEYGCFDGSLGKRFAIPTENSDLAPAWMRDEEGRVPQFGTLLTYFIQDDGKAVLLCVDLETEGDEDARSDTEGG